MKLQEAIKRQYKFSGKEIAKTPSEAVYHVYADNGIDVNMSSPKFKGWVQKVTKSVDIMKDYNENNGEGIYDTLIKIGALT